MTPISRRTVARSAAWMTPAVLLTSAAPAASASTTTETPLQVTLCGLPMTNDGTGTNVFSASGTADSVTLTGSTPCISLSSVAEQDPRITGYRLVPVSPTVFVEFVVGPDMIASPVTGLALTSSATETTPISSPFQLTYSGTVAVPAGGTVCDNNSVTSPDPNSYVAWVALGSTEPAFTPLPPAYTLEFYGESGLLGSYPLQSTTLNGTMSLSTEPALVVSEDCGMQNAYIQCTWSEGGGS